jgi:predicted HD phosphohydrolase
MSIDREVFFEVLGGEGAVATMSDEARADALEHYMIESLNDTTNLGTPAYLEEQATFLQSSTPKVRRGTGAIFGDGHREPSVLAPMPDRPTLIDFFLLRTSMPTVRHLLQSAAAAQKTGASEEQILACLLHDLGQALMKVDHGWWGAQLVEPYVSEKVSWAVRYHQALRFFADESVGYSYPELYVNIFGKDYVPEPYVREAYESARRHPWYMEARMVTVHDLYAFDPDATVSLDPFVDIIGRNFRQPKEGLGFDGSPVGHMWRSLIFPDHRL